VSSPVDSDDTSFLSQTSATTSPNPIPSPIFSRNLLRTCRGGPLRCVHGGGRSFLEYSTEHTACLGHQNSWSCFIFSCPLPSLSSPPTHNTLPHQQHHLPSSFSCIGTLTIQLWQHSIQLVTPFKRLFASPPTSPPRNISRNRLFARQQEPESELTLMALSLGRVK